ncbi:MAG: FkbM family methyltransferase [Terricaulis sp.]
MTAESAKTVRLHPLPKTAAGFEFEPLEGDSIIAQSVRDTGTYEPEILAAFELFLRPGDTFVDVGANFGWHSVHAARIVGSAGKVFAFEPVPYIAEVLERNCRRNGFNNVEVHRIALGARQAQVKMALNSENPGGGCVADFGTLPVHMFALDQVIADARPTLIKIDVEGHEMEVLRGANRTLDAEPVVVLEYNRGPHRKRIFRYLSDRGYSLYIVSDALAFNWLRMPYVPQDFENIVAVPKRLAHIVSPATAIDYPHLLLWLRYAPPRMARQAANFVARKLGLAERRKADP